MNQKMVSSSLTVSLSLEVNFRGVPLMLEGTEPVQNCQRARQMTLNYKVNS